MFSDLGLRRENIGRCMIIEPWSSKVANKGKPKDVIDEITKSEYRMAILLRKSVFRDIHPITDNEIRWYDEKFDLYSKKMRE